MKKLKSISLCIILIMLISSLYLPATLFSQEADLFSKINANDIEGVTALIAAGADLNAREEFYNMTPLLWALTSNKTDMALLLINEGADINLKASNESTALILAARISSEITELLLSKGADVNARSDNGTGAFTNCVIGIIGERVNTDLAELLLANGAEIDEFNTTTYYKGYTPLFWAVEDNNEELVKFLVDHGANVNATDKEGLTPLAIAKEAGYNNVAKVLKSKGAK